MNRPCPEAENLIRLLALEPLPGEGGWVRQVWRDPLGTESRALFLLAGDGLSALHRLAAAETWTFLAGQPVEHVVLGPEGRTTRRLGLPESSQTISQVVVEKGVWQGARLMTPGGWALILCTVTPAWDDTGFELGDRLSLKAAYPAQEALVEAFTRRPNACCQETASG